MNKHAIQQDAAGTLHLLQDGQALCGAQTLQTTVTADRLQDHAAKVCDICEWAVGLECPVCGEKQHSRAEVHRHEAAA